MTWGGGGLGTGTEETSKNNKTIEHYGKTIETNWRL